MNKSKENNKSKFEQFLVEVNSFIESEAAKKDIERSYIRLFRPYNTNKINIMGSFAEAIEEESKGSNGAETFNKNSKRSLGMVATEQFSGYCFLHSKYRNVFEDFNRFTSYVNKNYMNFVIDDSELRRAIDKLEEFEQKKPGSCELYNIYNSLGIEEKGNDRKLGAFKQVLQKALYARCLMVAYYSCGLTIYGETEQIKCLRDNLSDLEKKYQKDNKYEELILGFDSIEENEIKNRKGFSKLLIKGVPLDETFEAIDNLGYRIVEKNNKLFLSSDKKDNSLSFYFDNKIIFVLDTIEQEKFVDLLKADSQIIVYPMNEDSFVVKYFPSKETIKGIESLKLSFVYDAGSGKVTVKDEGKLKPGETKRALRDVYDELYEKLKYYKSNAGALYSGVIPRLTKVLHREPSMDNATVEGMLLNLGRTSYFTMRSMGRSVAPNHLFMNEEFDFGVYKGRVRDVTNAVDAYEIMVQDEYYESINKTDEEYAKLMDKGLDIYFDKIEKDIDCLNNYLKYSFAQHNINISGNLITEDGVCLYTQRGGNIEDTGDYYPSTNGGSEIYDKRVDFYRNSVEEDIPSIRYTSENVYFGQELTRESIAELGLIDDSHVWNFYGLTCMGQKKEQKEHRMSFHFNVLGERRCMDKFEHIVEQKEKSAENFESKALYGYRFEIHHNLWGKIGSFFINTLLPVVIDNKDTIVWLMVFFISWFGHKHASNNGIEDILTLLFVVASAIMIIYKSYHFWMIRKHEKMVSIVVNDSNILDINAVCNDICKKLKISDHKRMDNVLRLLTLMRLSIHFNDSND